MLYLISLFSGFRIIFNQKFFIGLKGCVKHPFFLLENILECRFSVFLPAVSRIAEAWGKPDKLLHPYYITPKNKEQYLNGSFIK